MDAKEALVLSDLRALVRAHRGRYAELSRESGISVSWLSKFGRGQYESPGVGTVERVRAAIERLAAVDEAA